MIVIPISSEHIRMGLDFPPDFYYNFQKKMKTLFEVLCELVDKNGNDYDLGEKTRDLITQMRKFQTDISADPNAKSNIIINGGDRFLTESN